MSGGIKFFKEDKALAGLGNTIAASSNDSVSGLMIDGDPATKWASSGSDDLTTETVTLTFDAPTTIDRLFLQNVNLKEFDVMYDAGAGFVDFTNVTGLDGALASIAETVFADSTAYYAFDSVTVDAIRIQALKTQTVDAEKFIASIIATEELGTLLGFPAVGGPTFTENGRSYETLSHRRKTLKSTITLSFGLDYLMAPDQNDVDIFLLLHERTSPFLVWLCGGLRGETEFRQVVKGYRIGDIYKVQTRGDLTQSFFSGVYRLPVAQSLSFAEEA